MRFLIVLFFFYSFPVAATVYYCSGEECGCNTVAQTTASCALQKLASNQTEAPCKQTYNGFTDSTQSTYRLAVEYPFPTCDTPFEVSVEISKTECSEGQIPHISGNAFSCVSDCPEGQIREILGEITLDSCVCPDVKPEEQRGVCITSECASLSTQCVNKCGSQDKVKQFSCSENSLFDDCVCDVADVTNPKPDNFNTGAGHTVNIAGTIDQTTGTTDLTIELPDEINFSESNDEFVKSSDHTLTEIEQRLDFNNQKILHGLESENIANYGQGRTEASKLHSSLHQLQTWFMPQITLQGGCTLGELVFFDRVIPLSLCPYLDIFLYIGNFIYFFASIRAFFIILDFVGR